MLKRITDCKNRCACYADAETGKVEHLWKRVKATAYISIGEKFEIEREDTITILTRISTEEFSITSYEITQ